MNEYNGLFYQNCLSKYFVVYYASYLLKMSTNLTHINEWEHRGKIKRMMSNTQDRRKFVLFGRVCSDWLLF